MNAWTYVAYPDLVRHSQSISHSSEADTQFRRDRIEHIQVVQNQPLSILMKISSDIDSPDNSIECNFEDEEIEESECRDRLNKEHYQQLIQHIRRLKPLPTLYIS